MRIRKQKNENDQCVHGSDHMSLAVAIYQRVLNLDFQLKKKDHFTTSILLCS